MGKPSRRKGGNKKLDKKEHKALQQDRRRERSEHDDSKEEEEDRLDYTSKLFFPGDRVFFYDGRSDKEDPNTYRGIVREVVGDGTLHILPLSHSLSEDSLKNDGMDVWKTDI